MLAHFRDPVGSGVISIGEGRGAPVVLGMDVHQQRICEDRDAPIARRVDLAVHGSHHNPSNHAPLWGEMGK